MITKTKHGYLRNYSTDMRYNVCRSCKSSKITPTTQGDFVTCKYDGKEYWQSANVHNNCKDYSKSFCWILR